MARKDCTNRGWLRRWFARPAASGPDAADYGTAFGMELSFEPPATAHEARSKVDDTLGHSWVQTLTSGVRHRLGRLRTAV